ncbi:isoprenylcysteine carboxyl methyltransferase [Lasiosphaeria hispida]|uniref:Protein-S-isoprenylcysteine O-methyltransferase n=1 Tax=Lasiosphaeria hispida TaxID=260671 RepID=A0AAJ0MFG0_9PEZI|nr:isoprenylcysteine carboxyl methyltransferase [Lasiosphaeria hispida]
MSPGAASIALSGAFLFSAALTHRAWTPPNPSPTHGSSSPSSSPLPKDDAGIIWRRAQTRRLVASILWLVHALFTLFYPTPPTLFCPNPDNLSPILFTWTPFATAVIAIIAIAAPIRLLAFEQLGENFTFRLARPKTKRLVTTGLYRFVQHPSYPTNWLILVANLALLLRLDGVLGCFLPNAVVKFAMGGGVWLGVLVGVGGLAMWGVWTRVKHEEAMLKEVFGKEWEEYHARTKRFVPWVV